MNATLARRRRGLTLTGALWAAYAPRDAYLWACTSVLALVGSAVLAVAAAVVQ